MKFKDKNDSLTKQITCIETNLKNMESEHSNKIKSLKEKMKQKNENISEKNNTIEALKEEQIKKDKLQVKKIN